MSYRKIESHDFYVAFKFEWILQRIEGFEGTITVSYQKIRNYLHEEPIPDVPGKTFTKALYNTFDSRFSKNDSCFFESIWSMDRRETWKRRSSWLIIHQRWYPIHFWIRHEADQKRQPTAFSGRHVCGFRQNRCSFGGWRQKVACEQAG